MGHARAAYSVSRTHSQGVGTELSRMLGRCQKFQHQQQLDDWGVACLEHIPEIVAWVQEFSLTFQDTQMDAHTIERILRLVVERVQTKSQVVKEVDDGSAK